MNVTLLRPNIGSLEQGRFVDEARMEPLGLGVLAALAPADISLRLVDDRIESISYDAPCDLVAITVETFTARRAYEIAAEYRRRGVPVVMGGVHATLAPEEVAGHCDCLYTGDAETLWPRLLEDARAGRLAPRYDAPRGARDVADAVAPQALPQGGLSARRDLYSKDYLPISLLQFGRGCRFRCAYCAIGAYFRGSCSYRRAEEVVAEIASQGRRHLFFVDDNLTADREAAKALFRGLIPLKVRWVSQASIDMTEDEELMELMARSGCLGHVVGFESLSAESLAMADKTPNLGYARNRYAEPLKILREYGLQTWAAFTLGHDGDTEDGIKALVDFAGENRFAFAAFNILMPYPGTPLYVRLEREGRLLYGGRWWLHPDYRFNYAAFRPAHMSAERLTEMAFSCRSAFNSPYSIVRRAFDFRTNMRSFERLFLYAAYNPLFRRETFKKQGMRLGTRPETAP